MFLCSTFDLRTSSPFPPVLISENKEASEPEQPLRPRAGPSSHTSSLSSILQSFSPEQQQQQQQQQPDNAIYYVLGHNISAAQTVVTATEAVVSAEANTTKALAALKAEQEERAEALLFLKALMQQEGVSIAGQKAIVDARVGHVAQFRALTEADFERIGIDIVTCRRNTLRLCMHEHGLTDQEQEKLMSEGVTTQSIFRGLETSTFTAYGIDIEKRRAQAACRRWMEKEVAVSAAGRASVLAKVDDIRGLLALNAVSMRQLGLFELLSPKDAQELITIITVNPHCFCRRFDARLNLLQAEWSMRSGDVDLSYRGRPFSDDSGVLYYLGTKGLTQGWINPSTSGQVICSWSSVGSTPHAEGNFVAHWPPPYIYTRAQSNSWMAVDLGPDYRLSIAHYALRNSASGTYALRNWKLQGALNMAGPWTTLRHHKNDKTLVHGAKHFEAAWPIEDAKIKPFRCFRVLQTGPNSGADCDAVGPMVEGLGDAWSSGLSSHNQRTSRSNAEAVAGGVLTTVAVAGGLVVSTTAVVAAGAVSLVALGVDAVCERDALACGGIELYGKLTLFQGFTTHDGG
eukprot:COSAG02_NODE_6701_length_3413_cov_30.264937_2_plen_572_part_00